MKKKQRLVAVRINTLSSAVNAANAANTQGTPAITTVDGEPLEEILESWRIVQIQPLGTQGSGPEYAALLLLEEAPGEASLGRLGFGQP
jgi:hypothetical protein